MSAGLAACWKMEGDGADASGNSNTASFADGQQFVEGRWGLAAAFSGNGLNYAIVYDHASLHVEDAWSMSVWVYPTDLTNRRCVYSTRTGGDAGSWQLEVGTGSGGTATVVCTAPGLFWLQGANGILNLNDWNHIVVTKTGATRQIWTNGVKRALAIDAAFTSVANANAKYIGKQSTGNAMVGNIDELRLYNRVLSDAEILKLYTANTDVLQSDAAELLILGGDT